MIHAVRLAGLKCFPPTGVTIELAPLTLVLGANSSGKTTLLQSFLAVAQSWSQPSTIRTFESVGNLVDLGQFKHLLWRGQPGHWKNPERLNDHDNNDVEREPWLSIEFDLRKQRGLDELTVLGHELRWSAGTDTMKHHSQGLLESLTSRVSTGPGEKKDHVSLQFNVVSSPEDFDDTRLHLALDFQSISDWIKQWPEDESAARLYEHSDAFQLQFTIDDQRVGFDPPEIDEVESESVEETPNIRAELEQDVRNALKDDISSDASLIRVAMNAIENCFDKLRGQLLQIAHVGGLRARGQRIYHLRPSSHQGRVGHNGSRMVDILADSEEALNEANRLLDKVTKDNLSFELTSLNSGAAAVELSLKRPGDERGVMLPDLGSGVAQVAPVLVQIASARAGVMGSGRQLLLFEQPELHLHPRWAGRLAAVLAEAVQQDSVHDSEELNQADPPQIIAETHSEHLILAVGNWLQQQERPPTDSVKCLAFYENEGSPQITTISFDKHGHFENRWPGDGFFPERDMLQFGEEL